MVKCPAVAVFLEALLRIGLHGGHGAQGLVDDGVGFRRCRLYVFGVLANSASEGHAENYHKGQHQEHEARQRGGLVDQKGDSAHNDDDLANEFGQRTGKRFLKDADVALKAVGEFADALFVKKRQRKAHQMVVHGRP